LLRLEGLVAVVTGAARGIGRAYAEGYAGEGARVVLADIDAAAAADAATAIVDRGGDATGLGVDMADVGSVRTMVAAAAEWGGSVDILLNNAGIGIAKPLLETTEEDWDRQIDVNLKGMFFAIQAVLPHMLKTGRGKIINIASTSGFVSSTTPEVAYDVSKGGVRQLTVAVAAELAASGINVNGIAPGTIETELTRQILNTPERRARAEEKIPLGRVGTPSDLVGAAIFLASRESDYVTGHTLVVDGGWLLY
jgi:NAD(P)-dependent dehydrogenase (short-subunit alcohol dehydrogenase family)